MLTARAIAPFVLVRMFCARPKRIRAMCWREIPETRASTAGLMRFLRSTLSSFVRLGVRLMVLPGGGEVGRSCRRRAGRMRGERASGVTTYFAEGSPHARLPAEGGAAALFRVRFVRQRAAPVVLPRGRDSHAPLTRER